MARIEVHDGDGSYDGGVLVEGLPGVGLVGKIATDHLVSQLEMTHVASLRDCEGLPRLATYSAGDYAVRSPIRFYASDDGALLAMQCDVPVPREAAKGFADALTDWLAAEDVLPIYLSGMATEEKATPPALFGVATAGAENRLEAAGIDAPAENGLVSGPTGSLIATAAEEGVPSVGLVVESNGQFPDPEAARIVLQDGVQPIADVDVPLDALVEQATEIREAKEQLAQQLQEGADHESTEAKPLRMYQ